jgi:translocation and assembly module TamB
MLFRGRIEKLKSRVSRKGLFLIVLALFAVAALLFLRGPYISNFLKMAILSELRDATGRQVIARRIYVNVLPLFIEARGVKAFDEAGARVFKAERIKGYLGLSDVLRRRIVVERVVLVEPEVWADRAEVEEILDEARKHGRKKGGFFRLDLNAVVIKDGEISFHDERRNAIHSARGIEAEMVLRERPKMDFSVAELASSVEGWPNLKGGVKGTAVLEEDALRLRNLKVDSMGSTLKADGFYRWDGNAEFDVDLKLLVDAVKKTLDLRSQGEGTVFARGKVKTTGELREPLLELAMNGDFHLETLMELLHVKPRHDLTGYITFNGELSGRVPDLKGSADAGMERGSFFSVKTERARCRVIYEEGVLSFRDGEAELYGGEAKVEVSIRIPRVIPYSVSVGFSGADSASALGLIDLDWLGLSEGTAWGELKSTGKAFEPVGWFLYKSEGGTDSPLGRVSYAKGGFRVRGSTVSLPGFEAGTEHSSLSFDGYLDRATRALSFSGRLATSDVNDVASPYYTKLGGAGEFVGSLRGTVENPFLEGKVKMSGAKVDRLSIGDLEGEVIYRKDLFRIISARAHEGKNMHGVGGYIRFPGDRKALDLRGAEYNLDVSLMGADLNGMLRLMGLDVPVNGELRTGFTISGSGRNPVYSGRASVSKAEFYGRPVSSASADFSYGLEGFYKLDNAVLTEGSSTVALDGSLGKEGDFQFNVSSDRVSLRHLFRETLPLDYDVALKARGRGTLEDPMIDVSAKLSGGVFKGAGMGGGEIRASLKGRKLDIDSSLLDEGLSLRGRAVLRDEMPWSAEVEIRQGRFDFLLIPLLEEVPEDLMINVTGSAAFKGDRRQIEASVALSRINLNMFAQGFVNETDVLVSVNDRKVSMEGFTLRSGNTSVGVSGNLELGSSYDVYIEGDSLLSPMSALSGEVEKLRGRADFVFRVKGDWEEPGINGALVVRNAALALKRLPQHFTAVNGYIYVDGDRAVLNDFHANLGGGDISISGVAMLKGFGVERIYLDAVLSNVTASVSKRFDVNLGGSLIFRDTARSRDITGDVRINRASYRARTEWKSWLISSRRREAVKAGEGWADTVGLNVRLSGSEGILVDNNIARAPLKVDTLLRGTLGNPLLLGRVETATGKLFFRNSELTILGATADFSDLFANDPFLMMAAETSIQGYHIMLNLEGRMEQLDLTLGSDPPLDEVEILGLLTLGEFGEGLEGLEGGIGAAEATSFVTGKFQDVVEERFKDITGVDRFQIDPYVSKSTGTVTPRVTVSKRLVGDKLFVTYAAAMGSSEEQELELEYVLGPNVSLVGGRDDTGSLGGDIKFRFRFK